MNVAPVVLCDAQLVPTSTTKVYTAPAGKTTIVDKFTGTNTDSGTRTLTVYLVKSGGVPVAANTIMVFGIGAGVTKDFTELQNQILAPGDAIIVQADTGAKVVVRGSGRECG